MDTWLIIGLAGQTLFALRFLVQWVCSEKRGQSYIPEIFWYFSLAGGTILLAYAIRRQDPVFMIGQFTGLVVYFRNLCLIREQKRPDVEVLAGETA